MIQTDLLPQAAPWEIGLAILISVWVGWGIGTALIWLVHWIGDHRMYAEAAKFERAPRDSAPVRA
jgi:hypothetical protein